MLNPKQNIVDSITNRIEKNDGLCPCVHNESDTGDLHCPCETYRNHETCCCQLYVAITVENLKKEIFSEEKPHGWRDGQMVFNYMDEMYGVSRDVQFNDKVDCFYNDGKIDEFLECCRKRIIEAQRPNRRIILTMQ